VSPNPRAQVRSCADCPLCNRDDEGQHCNHPHTAGADTESSKDVPPQWCPLRTAPLMLWFASLGAERAALGLEGRLQ
jgi:hypothetical protein